MLHIPHVMSLLMIFQRLGVTFLTVSIDDLKKAGIQKRYLRIVAANIANLTNRLAMDNEAQIMDLHSRIKDIYACVNMDVSLIQYNHFFI